MTGGNAPASASSGSVFEPGAANKGDDLAAAEAINLESGVDLEKDGKEQEHRRHQQFRNHANGAALFLFWVLVACLAFGIIAFAYHMLTPAGWHWMGEEALDKLQTLLGAAILSSALTQYVSKRME